MQYEVTGKYVVNCAKHSEEPEKGCSVCDLFTNFERRKQEFVAARTAFMARLLEMCKRKDAIICNIK